MTIITSQFRRTPYIHYTTTGDGPRENGVETMSWHNSAKVTMDCVAVVTGLLMASPFLLILASPFLVTY